MAAVNRRDGILSKPRPKPSSMMTPFNISVIFLLTTVVRVSAFSTPQPQSGGGGGDASYTLFDRFRADCPADLSSVRAFDPSLSPSGEEDDATWVAVFRSSNNLPSVMVRDDFMNAMRIATTVETDSGPASKTTKVSESIEVQSSQSGVEATTPVAVARLRPSPDFSGSYVIDDMRCTLKKEETNDACDGGSEHCECVGVCVDELLMHHLRSGSSNFDGAIRCKATPVSGPLLEERGFKAIEEFPLPKDMATHVSSLDASMEKFADRVVSKAAKNPGARDRALVILSLLGRLNREEEMKAAKQRDDAKNEDDDRDEYDPWANVKLTGL